MMKSPEGTLVNCDWEDALFHAAEKIAKVSMTVVAFSKFIDLSLNFFVMWDLLKIECTNISAD